MRRRKPDTMEIQQMKAQAKEEKQRRQIEKKKLAKEIELRKNAEREKQQLEQQLMQLQGDMRSASEALVCMLCVSIYPLRQFVTNNKNVSSVLFRVASIRRDSRNLCGKKSPQRRGSFADRTQSAHIQTGNGSITREPHKNGK